jgi:cytochrome P450
VAWTILLLSENPILQGRLRSELLSIQPLPPASALAEDEIQSLYASIADLPFLDNVVRESIRLIPPGHSSIRVATQDDELPTSYPVYNRDRSASDRTSVSILKGTFVHVAIEGFNLDKSFWGENSWKFQCVVRVLSTPPLLM